MEDLPDCDDEEEIEAKETQKEMEVIEKREELLAQLEELQEQRTNQEQEQNEERRMLWLQLVEQRDQVRALLAGPSPPTGLTLLLAQLEAAIISKVPR